MLHKIIAAIVVVVAWIITANAAAKGARSIEPNAHLGQGIVGLALMIFAVGIA